MLSPIEARTILEKLWSGELGAGFLRMVSLSEKIEGILYQINEGHGDALGRNTKGVVDLGRT